MHHIRSKHDYQKHHLTPLRNSPPPLLPLQTRAHQSVRRTAREREWGRRHRRELEEADELERAIDKRRWVYQHRLYAKHVASNTFTRYRPFPSPAQFATSQDYTRRATIFIRRELRVWVNLDVEFLTTFILSLMRSIDIRSESAIKLLAEFLDMDTPYVEGGRFLNSEHFAHELYSYLRSPYKDLTTYDGAVQYDVPADLEAPQAREYSTRWRTPDRHSSLSPPDLELSLNTHPQFPNDNSASHTSPERSHPRHGEADRRTGYDNDEEPTPPMASDPEVITLAHSVEGSNLEPRRHISRETSTGSHSDRKGKQRQYPMQNVDMSRVTHIGHVNVTSRLLSTNPPIAAHVAPESSPSITDKRPDPRPADTVAVRFDSGVHPAPSSPDIGPSNNGKRENHAGGPIKINRNRNPLASAQAYLLRALDERRQSIDRDAVPIAGKVNHGLINTPTPTLLHRSSEPHNIPCLAVAARAEVCSEGSSIHSSTTVPRAHTSINDVIDRTRTKLRKFDKPLVNDHDDVSKGHPAAGCHEQSYVTLSAPSEGAACSTAASGLRAKLLQKLEQEKAQQLTHAMLLPSRPDIASTSESEYSEARPRQNQHTIDARLRSQARLRLKLAAERRTATQANEHQLVERTDGQVRAFVGKAPSCEQGREELLRVKLRQRPS